VYKIAIYGLLKKTDRTYRHWDWEINYVSGQKSSSTFLVPVHSV